MASLLVSLAVALGETVLVGRAWASCDVGINATANAWTLLLLGIPALWLVNATALFAVAVVSRRLLPSGTWRLFLATLALLLVAAVILVFVATPAGYPDPICTDNIPAWWPSWLPS